MTQQPEVAPFTERTPRVVAVRKLMRRRHRDQERQFLAEGPQAVREALSSQQGGGGPAAVALFVASGALERYGRLIQSARTQGVAVNIATDEALASLSETTTPQGIVAVCAYVDISLEQLTSSRPRLVAVLSNVRDPGNAGTILRTADAAGADGVIFSDSSVDPYNGKTVRAAVGSVFHLPIVRGGDVETIAAALRDAGLRTYATSADGERSLFDCTDEELGPPTAWMFGNEAHGLGDEVAALAHAKVSIPILGRAESLNLAVAAGICLYASAREQQRLGARE